MKNPTLSLSLLESEITRLYMIQQVIASFAEQLETTLPANAEPGWGIDKPLRLIAKAMNPDLTEEEVALCGRLPVLTLAANTSFSLLAALKLARGAPRAKGRISADILIEAARKKRTGEYQDREDFLQHLPWLIQSALDYLCTDIDCEPTLNTGGAIGMRLLAAILDALEAHGLERTAPKEETQAMAKGKTIKDKTIREEQGRYQVTRDPGIQPGTWVHASFH